MKNRHRLVAAASTALLASSASAATLCVKPPPAGACFATIQAAIDAAGRGDVVKIGAGTYFEAVTVPAGKDGLQLLGASKLTTILDPGPRTEPPSSAGGVGVTVDAPGVTVRNLMIRNGDSYGVVLAAPEATVQGLNITGANFAGIWAQPPAWYAKLLQNEIHNTQTGVVSEAFGTLAQANFITGAQTGVFLVDHGGRVAVNKVYGGVTGVFVLAGAEGAVITGNDIRHQANIGILVANARSLAIEGNRLFGVGIGIEAHCVACTGAAIASNTITDAVRYGILARSDDVGLVLQSNTVLRAARGLSVSGVGARVRLNKATDIGLDGFGPCFEIFGSANTAMQNTATRCSLTGVFLFGSTNRIESNTVAGTFENGITVSGPGTNSGNLLRANKVTGSAAQGVAVVGGASNTLVVGNSATGNRLDYCDDGVGTMAAGNAFGTVDYLGNPHCTVSH